MCKRIFFILCYFILSGAHDLGHHFNAHALDSDHHHSLSCVLYAFSAERADHHNRRSDSDCPICRYLPQAGLCLLVALLAIFLRPLEQISFAIFRGYIPIPVSVSVQTVRSRAPPRL